MKDVNNTRYHLILGPNEWGTRPAATETSETSETSTSEVVPPEETWKYSEHRRGIQLLPKVFSFQQTGQQAQPLKPEDRRDSDFDTYGHRYWIDKTGTQIRVRWAEAQSAETLFPLPATDCDRDASSAFQPVEPAPSEPESLAGLAVMNEGYLVVGSPDTGSLLVFDLYALDGGFLRVSLPGAESSNPPKPFDLVTCADGGLLVLDRENKQVWKLDQQLNLVSFVADRDDAVSTPMLFQPAVGEVRQQQSQADVRPLVLTDVENPVAIASLPDNGFLILDTPANAAFSRLWHYPQNSTTPQPSLRDLESDQILGYDLVYLPSPQSLGSLFVADVSGNQAYALTITASTPLALDIEQRYYPMRNLDGVSLVAARSNPHVEERSEGDVAKQDVYYLQTGDRWFPIKELPKRRYYPEALLVLPAMDGHEPNCIWHRLCIDACLPPETAIGIEVRAAETIADLSTAHWQLQPTLYRRSGTEIPYGSLWQADEQNDPDAGTWELLFQQVQGRYIEIRLTLTGNGRRTPLVRSLRAHYPRFSYLREYLPDVYQQDPTSHSFLDRFLSNPEGIFTTLEGAIAQVQTHFDPRTVSPESVEWLASWIGLALDPYWSDYQRRLLIAQAPYFYQRRGTVVGLLQIVLLTLYPEFGPRIFTDDVATLCPTVRIVERFLTRRQSSVAAGDPTESESSLSNTAKDLAHRFTVLIPTTLSDTMQRLIEQLIELEKPAHTAFTIKQYWAMFRVGEVRLGIDTVLGRGGQFETFEIGRSALAEATLGDAFPYHLRNRTVLRQ